MGGTASDGVEITPATRVELFPRPVGEYDLLSQLGHGGMGVVYLARRKVDGAHVALKTVHTEGEVSLRAIRREIHALSRLRHPSVVQIVDQGVTDGAPWYAMEYVLGPTLRGRIGGETTATWSPDAAPPRDAPRTLLPLAETLHIGVSICRALSYLHGEGVVHRDLKPSNIILPPSGGVVLVDFGLTAAVSDQAGRDVLEGGVLAIGTAAYVSPEQIRGEFVDARADLYSLGCVLYELATGRPPFVGESAELLLAHEHATPAAPSTFHPLPPELDDLILRLLSKDVDKRVGHAADVERVLVRLGASSDETPAPRSQPYLYRPRFVARVDLAERVTDRLIRTDGKTAYVLVAGESGSGKTRLAHEVAVRVRKSAVRVVTAQCVPVDDGAKPSAAVIHPFRDVLTTIADQCRAGGPAVTAQLLGAHCRVLAKYEPLLAWVPGYDSYADPDPLSPEAERERLLRALDGALEQLARDGRIVVIFEDLQWADQLTRLYISGISSGHYGGAWLSVLGTYRLDEADDGLRELVDPRGIAPLRITLQPMGEPEVGSLIAGMLALERCPDELSFIIERAGGNPFFAGELLRALVAEDRLERVDGDWRFVAGTEYAISNMPRAMQEIIARRLARLSPNARRMADLAAVLGRETELTLLEAASDLDEAARLDAIDELLSRQILEERGAGRLRFNHDQIRDTIYRLLETNQRRRLHRACAEALERGDITLPRTQQLLAHHFGECGDDARAIGYLANVVDHALSRGAYKDARIAALNAVAHRARSRADGPDVAAWERRNAQACLGLGELEACETHARAALAAAVAEPPRSRIGWGALLAREATRQASHLVLPQEWIQRTDPGALVDAAQVAGVMGRLAFYANDPLRMLACSFWSINLAEAAGADVERPRNYAGLGFTMTLAGATGLGDHYFRRARSAGRRDLAGLTFALTTEALSYAGNGRWDKALSAIRQADEVCERTGDPQDRELVAVLASYPLYYRGIFNEAARRLDGALKSATARGNTQTEGWATFLLGRIALAVGDLDEAERRLSAALETMTLQPDLMSELACAGLLLETRTLRGDLPGAGETATRLTRLVSRNVPTVFLVGHAYLGLVAYYLLVGRRARAAGDVAGAREAMRQMSIFVQRLSRAAWIFPVLAPDAYRMSGEAAFVEGDFAKAQREFERSAARARALEMRHHEALARIALSRTLDEGDSLRTRLLDEARAQLEGIGCRTRFELESRQH